MFAVNVIKTGFALNAINANALSAPDSLRDYCPGDIMIRNSLHFLGSWNWDSTS